MARQLLVLGLALSLWASLGRAELLSALLAYLVAIAVMSTGPARRLLVSLTPWHLALLALLMAAPGVAFGYKARSQLAEREGLHGLTTQLNDRLRLESLPSIAPALVSSERPQTFFVHAPGAQHIQVRFGSQAQPVTGEAFGHGLFRVDYDPRRDGLPDAQHGKVNITIHADEREVVRELHASTPFAHPRWLALSPDRTLAATVSEETDELIVLDRHGLRLRVKVGDGPSDCVFVDDAHLVVSYVDYSQLQLIALDSGRSVREVEVGARQARLAISPDLSTIAVALADGKPSVAFVTGSNTSYGPPNGPSAALRLSSRVTLDAAPDWLAFGSDASTLIVTTRNPAQILRLRRSATGYSVDKRLPLVRPVVTLARGAQGNQLLMAATDYQPQGRVRLGNHFVQDQLLLLDTESMHVREQWLTARRSERQSNPGDLDRGLSPMGIAEARHRPAHRQLDAQPHAQPNTQWLISFAGSDELWRAASAASPPAIIDLVDTALHAPHGLAELDDGTLIVASPSAGALGIIAPGADEPKLVRLAPDDDALLKRDSLLLARRVGERGFYEGTRSGISCQSCHLHADSDDAMHNLGGYVLVPTLSVRGITGTAPYLRDGSYPKLSDLDELAQTLYRGYLRKQAARGDTLTAYLESLPRARNPVPIDERDPARERRGWSAFVKARCPSCHAPPAFTQLGSIPLHTLFPEQAAMQRERELLDTPSLLSLARSPPYLSDGRAATIDAVISTHNRRNLHGDTQGLSVSERQDLVAFLASL